MNFLIETDFQGPGFVAVPNYVLDIPELQPDALGVLVFLARLPKGFVLRPTVIMERFAMGRDKWQRIARELRDLGALRLVQHRDHKGQIIGSSYAVRWPNGVQSTENRKTRLLDKTTENHRKTGNRVSRQKNAENPQKNAENPVLYTKPKEERAASLRVSADAARDIMEKNGFMKR